MFSATVHARTVGSLGVVLKSCETRCGLIITAVRNGSAADKAGLLPGDIIKYLNGVRVYDDMEGVLNYFQSNPDRNVNLSVYHPTNGRIEDGHVYLDAIDKPDNRPTINPPDENNTNSYPPAEPKGTVINNYYYGDQKNETNQNGTGNSASQNNDH